MGLATLSLSPKPGLHLVCCNPAMGGLSPAGTFLLGFVGSSHLISLLTPSQLLGRGMGWVLEPVD